MMVKLWVYCRAWRPLVEHRDLALVEIQTFCRRCSNSLSSSPAFQSPFSCSCTLSPARKPALSCRQLQLSHPVSSPSQGGRGCHFGPESAPSCLRRRTILQWRCEVEAVQRTGLGRSLEVAASRSGLHGCWLLVRASGSSLVCRLILSLSLLAMDVPEYGKE